VRDGKGAPLDRCAHQVRCAVLIRSPNECIIGGARAAPAKVRDWFRHESIGAEWQRGSGAEQFSPTRGHCRWIVGEEFCYDPLKKSTGTRECAAEDHPVTEWRRGWARPEALGECSGNAFGL
jgi:uncharacterized protein (DUF2235 family)